MKRLLKRLFTLSGALLFACASNSGVVPTGPDTYMISRTKWGIQHTGSSVKADVIGEAQKFCESKGKSVEVLEAEGKDMVPFKSEAQAEVSFRCTQTPP